jgi:hypothetical protein
LAEQGGEEFVVGDGFDFGDHIGAGFLIELLVGERGIGLRELGGEAVVLADEEGLDGGELIVFVGADVASQEELVVGEYARVVGVGKAFGVEGHEIAGAGFEESADKGAEGGGAGRIGAVDHGAVDEGGDVVLLLARVGGAGAGGGVEGGAGEIDDLRAGGVGVEVRITGGDGDVEDFGSSGSGEVEIVVEELAPGIDEGGHVAGVGVFAGGSVGGDGVADGAGAGARRPRGGRDAVGVCGGGFAEEVYVDGTPGGVGEVVAGAVDGAGVGDGSGGGQQPARFEQVDGGVEFLGLRVLETN